MSDPVRILFVGDPHATAEELGDCERLMDFAIDVAKQNRATICILGDSHHTHNIVRVEVMAFWRGVYKKARQESVPAVVLVGNHDYAGEGSTIHAIMAYEDLVTVVDAPVKEGGLLFLPYYSDPGEFVRAATEGGGKTLVCHQTFDGSTYENGFYAKDGVNPNLVPQEMIISGHIHTPQTVGKVTYVGAPRWRTLSDANVERAIWLYEFKDGHVQNKKPFDTSTVCRPIRYVVDSPDSPVDPGSLDLGVDWRIDVRGPADWVERRKTELAIPGARLRTFKTESGSAAVKESEGIAKAFYGYLETFVPKRGTPHDTLRDMARERLDV